jgi:hypothetical protein
MIVRFIGTVAEIGFGAIADFKHFGQSADLRDPIYTDAVLGGCAVLPELDFQAIGFTPQELKLYANPGPRQSAPDEFKVKHRRALDKLHANREALEHPSAAPEPSAPKK